MLFLSNPLGLWTLLGIPIILLIHFLQRRAKVEVVSTLFLLQRTQRESTSGRRFDRLVHSVPLWLQIFAVILLAWIISEPRYVKAKSTQRIAIVLDSSASMQVFKRKLPTILQNEISRLQGKAVNVEIWLLESDPAKNKIYQGSSPDDLLAALKSWSPTSGATAPSNALRVARSLVGAEGALTYITDTSPLSPYPYNASTIAIGSPTDNCGFTGVTFKERDGQLIWKAIVRNYSNTSQSRTWHIERPNQPVATFKKHALTIPPNQLLSLQGVFPSSSLRCRVVLSPDAFKLDDSLPLIAPAPKPLLVSSHLPDNLASLEDKMHDSFPNLQKVSDQSKTDLMLTSTETTPTSHHLIVFPRDRSTTRPYLTGNIVAPKHPLTEGLNWQTLLVRANIALPPTERDTVLLWQGNRPLIYLRTHPSSGKQALIFNFDIQQSNALKLPSTAVLLLRFCEQIRHQKVAPEARITETSEPLDITYHTGKQSPPLIYQTIDLNGKVLQSVRNPTTLAAPDTPGFFIITQNNAPLFTSATIFADTREANFSHCATEALPANTLATASDRHTRDDHLWRLWVALLIPTLLTAWHYTKPRHP